MRLASQTIFWLSTLGVMLILLGMVTLTLPFESEGPRLWELDAQHSITLLDLLSTGLMGVGVGLILVSAYLWNQRYGRGTRR